MNAIELFDEKVLVTAFDEEIPDYLTPPEAVAMIEAARLHNQRDELFPNHNHIARLCVETAEKE